MKEKKKKTTSELFIAFIRRAMGGKKLANHQRN